DLPGIEGGHATPVERAKRTQIQFGDVRRQLPDDAMLERERCEPVEIHLREFADRPADDLREQSSRLARARWPCPRVPHDYATNEFRATSRQTEADWTSPVLHHEREIVQAKAVDEFFERVALLARRESIPRRRRR